jgi:hypothetical protein
MLRGAGCGWGACTALLAAMCAIWQEGVGRTHTQTDLCLTPLPPLPTKAVPVLTGWKRCVSATAPTASTVHSPSIAAAKSPCSRHTRARRGSSASASEQA